MPVVPSLFLACHLENASKSISNWYARYARRGRAHHLPELSTTDKISPFAKEISLGSSGDALSVNEETKYLRGQFRENNGDSVGSDVQE